MTREWWVDSKDLGRNPSVSLLKPVLVSAQVTVSSGGMLTQKLNVDDLQFEKGTFDGTMAYAQNKVGSTAGHGCGAFARCLMCFCGFQRQQVILTERWAARHKHVHFSSMHPGWADTPGRLP